jgi:hypothetical protein
MRQHTDEANRQRQELLEELGDYHPGECARSLLIEMVTNKAYYYRLLLYNLTDWQVLEQLNTSLAFALYAHIHMYNLCEILTLNFLRS